MNFHAHNFWLLNWVWFLNVLAKFLISKAFNGGAWLLICYYYYEIAWLHKKTQPKPALN
jgi:hypothetical protein